ncbi:MAG: PP0621 family protein [Gammaproteobacteria bacterium]|nr:PP0621 family protein [Gammaproteobacteria bacterium]
MGIVRLIIIGVAVWLAFKLFKRMTSGPSTPESSVKESAPKKMVQCKQCGLHVPIDEALPKGDDHFCCDEHRDQD